MVHFLYFGHVNFKSSTRSPDECSFNSQKLTNLGIRRALYMLHSRVFYPLITLTQWSNILPRFCSLTLGSKMILFRGAPPTVVMGPQRQPITSRHAVIRMGVEGLRMVMRSKSWTEQGLHYALSFGWITQWYSTNRTGWVLPQPDVYAVHMERVTTIGEDTQHIFAAEFCKANCASVICRISLVGYINMKRKEVINMNVYVEGKPNPKI